MSTLQELKDEITAQPEVLAIKQKSQKNVGDYEKFGYAVLYEDEQGVAREVSHVIFVFDRETAQEAAYHMNKVPEFKQGNGVTQPLTDQEISDAMSGFGDSGDIVLEYQAAHKDSFTVLTVEYYDSSADVVKAERYAAANMGGNVQLRPYQPINVN